MVQSRPLPLDKVKDASATDHGSTRPPCIYTLLQSVRDKRTRPRSARLPGSSSLHLYFLFCSLLLIVSSIVCSPLSAWARLRIASRSGIVPSSVDFDFSSSACSFLLQTVLPISFDSFRPTRSGLPGSPSPFFFAPFVTRHCDHRLKQWRSSPQRIWPAQATSSSIFYESSTSSPSPLLLRAASLCSLRLSSSPK